MLRMSRNKWSWEVGCYRGAPHLFVKKLTLAYPSWSTSEKLSWYLRFKEGPRPIPRRPWPELMRTWPVPKWPWPAPAGPWPVPRCPASAAMFLKVWKSPKINLWKYPINISNGYMYIELFYELLGIGSWWLTINKGWKDITFRSIILCYSKMSIAKSVTLLPVILCHVQLRLDIFLRSHSFVLCFFIILIRRLFLDLKCSGLLSCTCIICIVFIWWNGFQIRGCPRHIPQHKSLF